MNNIRLAGLSTALITGLCLNPITIAMANASEINGVDIGTSAKESQWWSTYSIDVLNSSGADIDMRGATLEFVLPTSVSGFQFSGTGMTYPTWDLTTSPAADGVLHRIEFSFDEGSWIKDHLTANNSFAFSFGYDGTLEDISAFENSIVFSSKDGDVTPPPPVVEEPATVVAGLKGQYTIVDNAVDIAFNVETTAAVDAYAKLVQGEQVLTELSKTVDGVSDFVLQSQNAVAGSYEVVIGGTYDNDGQALPIAEQRFAVSFIEAEEEAPEITPTINVTGLTDQYELVDSAVNIPLTVESNTEILVEAKLVQGAQELVSVQQMVDGFLGLTLEGTNLAQGSYEVVVSGTYNDGETSTPVAEQRFAVTLQDKEEVALPPQVSFTSPNSGSLIKVNQAVQISVDASAEHNDLSNVSITANGTTICEFDAFSSNNFACDWTPTTIGSVKLTAIATDEENLSTSSNINITVIDENNLGNLSCDISQVYYTDSQGDVRECMGDDHPRRVVGYFTSWRNGSNGFPTYLVKDIPWDKITHINYAFAGLDSNTIEFTLDDSATEMEWPGVAGAEMDPALPYKGHFNLLNKYKKLYPDVKTILAVGGWAETGGFYSGTTNPNCTVNHEGIDKIATQSVEYVRKYGFDGIDYDYEYPTSMSDAGNPVDWPLSNICRGQLFENYVELMKVTREKLDEAGEEDGRKYLFTIASPSSAYLLRGMENFQVTQYLDFINLMTYDFHGTWNHFVGHNAALFDNRIDSELEAGGIYGTAQYKGIGYLNAAWTGQYFRGAVDPGKLNIGVPFYTRGWKDVEGGVNGYNGTSPLPQQSDCPAGTGLNDPCGAGAEGIDNLWHDVDDNGVEVAAGVVPMWHAKNLEHAQSLGLTDSIPSYGNEWGLDANNPKHLISGTYTRHFDEKAKVPWLWNASKKVFLSTEDEESMGHKIEYIKDRGFGGIMIWELAGDYGFDEERNEYYMGQTLVTQMYDGFKEAAPYSVQHNDILDTPTAQVDIDISVEFPVGDNNYPFNPKFTFTNNSAAEIPGGTVIQFLLPTSTSDVLTDWSGTGAEITYNAGNDNVQGERPNHMVEDFHVAELVLPSWQSLAPGGETTLDLVYYLPATIGTQSIRFLIDDQVVGIKSAFPELPEYAQGDATDPESPETDPENPGTAPEAPDTDPSDVVDWVGGQTTVSNGDIVRFQGECFKAKNNPGAWESPKAGSWFWDAVTCP
ncbi:putative chitinase [Vibrio halioticoli NBRC 102217]|uniref:Putative chitinase n=1 Tax=Vibrio halioticoli NBRC 102217 TaxID=1219072 RepID=V5F3I3_9VIBR|nr:glycosyl hydrolase family 18 protein [Vibrio halioticoli]GAD89739.1 putative chitinase [Vibrio halioticoli NBRC 102217]